MHTLRIPRSLTVRPGAGTSLLLGAVLACALLGLAPVAARAAVASSSVPAAGSGSGATGGAVPPKAAPSKRPPARPAARGARSR